MAEEIKIRPKPDTLDEDAGYGGTLRSAASVPADGDADLPFGGTARRDRSARKRAEQSDPLPAPLLPRRRAPRAGKKVS